MKKYQKQGGRNHIRPPCFRLLSFNHATLNTNIVIELERPEQGHNQQYNDHGHNCKR
jgi:hypothetical protein